MSFASPASVLPETSPESSTAPRTLALIDPRWCGHHPTFFKEMIHALLLAGYRVIGACPNPKEAHAYVEEAFAEEPEIRSRFLPLPFRDTEGLFPNTPLENDPVGTYRRWKEAARVVRTGEKKSGWKIDMVFFAWLDTLLRRGLFTSWPNLLGVPWSGLYFFCHHLNQSHGPVYRFLKGDHLLKNPQIRAIGLLDERQSGTMQDQFGISPIVFPDITNEEIPQEPTPLAREIRERARGRFTIGLISLEVRKGLLPLLRAALDSANGDRYFVFTGPFQSHWLNREDLALVQSVKAKIDSGAIDNIYLDLEGNRVPDGTGYNGLCQAFDVMPALYPNWEGSSNALTKAAILEKLVLCWDGGCIGPRVRLYDLGLCVDANDSTQVLRAIECLENGTDFAGRPLNPNFTAYRDFHSREQLRRSFDEIFALTVPSLVQPAN